MATDRQAMERRLARLREHDRTGYYASDEPATGSDRSGVVTMTIDPTYRVSRLQVRDPGDGVRTAEGLARAVEEAFRAARACRLDEVAPVRRTPGEIPTVSSVADPPIRRVESWMGTGRQRRERERVPRRHDTREDFGPAVGTSDNACVTVTLDIASPHGTVAADPGWLANAPAPRIGDAITQAFAAAYRERDRT